MPVMKPPGQPPRTIRARTTCASPIAMTPPKTVSRITAQVTSKGSAQPEVKGGLRKR